jgi:protein involved in polysaccharide export with SLBB domain
MSRETRRSTRAWRETRSFAFALCLVAVAPCGAQSTSVDLAAKRGTPSRAELDTVGDFRPGDRILLTLRIDSTTTDTLQVQPDRTIVLRQLPPISLSGVQRSDLQAYLSAKLRHYYTTGDVLLALALDRIGILGEVAHPGYYHVSPGIALGDALMVAGGPSAQADLTRIIVRRGGTTVLQGRNVRDAMVAGLPLSQLGIEAGDEIVVDAKRTTNWLLITQIATVVTGIVLTLHTFRVF